MSGYSTLLQVSMTSPLPHSGPTWARQTPLGRLLVCLLISLLGACGGAPEAGAVAKALLLRGDLDAAERALVGLEGEQVEQLRAQLASIRTEQAAAHDACQELLARAGELTSGELRAELGELAEATRGRWGREIVETEITRLDDIVASGEYSSLADRITAPVSQEETHEPVAAVSLPENWREREPGGARVTEGSALSAEELSGGGSSDGATGSTDESQLVSDPGQQPVVVNPGLGPDPTTAVGWEQRARALDEAGELSGAAEALFSAALLYEPGGLRDETLGLAQDYSDRALFASELAAAGHDIRVLEVDELLHHAEQLALSARAELGLVLELAARGEKTRAMQRMRELLGARRVEAQSAWPLIARMREETAPETGYLWFRGDYVRPEQHAQILLEEELDRLAELLPLLA